MSEDKNLQEAKKSHDIFAIKDDYSFTVTAMAKLKIKMLQREEKDDASVLRISIISGGCHGYQYYYEMTNEVNEDDMIIEDVDGVKIAIVDSVSIKMMNGSTLDFIANIGGSYFKVINPTVESSCGCGSSFST